MSMFIIGRVDYGVGVGAIMLGTGVGVAVGAARLGARVGVAVDGSWSNMPLGATANQNPKRPTPLVWPAAVSPENV